MRIAVTGGAGFIGSYVVERVKNRAHEAVVLSRRQQNFTSVGLVHRTADVLDRGSLEGAFDGVDAVIHLAAAKKGGFYDQYPSTVTGTRNVLDEAARARVGRVVLVSSFAVYDYANIPDGSLLDESSDVDHDGVGRDGYAQAKVLQESVSEDWARSSGVELVIARPGVVYGPGSWWTYRVGEQFGRLWLCFGGASEVPLSYVVNCADALVHLAVSREVEPGVFNVLDDYSPSQKEYLRRGMRAEFRRPIVVRIPWQVARLVVQGLASWNSGRAEKLRLPGFLVPESLAVRAKPIRVTNAKLRDSGWVPLYSTSDGLVETFEGVRAGPTWRLDPS